MPSDFQSDGRLRIKARRAGSALELSEFLVDMDSAYNALIRFRHIGWIRWRVPPWEIGYPTVHMSDYSFANDGAQTILPRERLQVASVEIHSPGVWEFVGSLNPLQQLREYLKDRHERIKDKSYRNVAEQERLLLENEILQRQIVDRDLEILERRIRIAKDLGLDEQEMRREAWARLGPPLAKLGHHQDTRLIEGPLEAVGGSDQTSVD